MIVEDLMLNASYFISPAGDSDGRNQFERKINIFHLRSLSDFLLAMLPSSSCLFISLLL